MRNTDISAANRERMQRADEHARLILAALERAYFDDEVTTNGKRAKWLNEHGYKTPRNKKWTKQQVRRLVLRVTAPGFRLSTDD